MRGVAFSYGVPRQTVWTYLGLSERPCLLHHPLAVLQLFLVVQRLVRLVHSCNLYLLLHPGSFSACGLQFGFKSKMSTSLCTGTVKNVVSRYIHEGSSVLACFLDASKAFS